MAKYIKNQQDADAFTRTFTATNANPQGKTFSEWTAGLRAQLPFGSAPSNNDILATSRNEISNMFQMVSRMITTTSASAFALTKLANFFKKDPLNTGDKFIVQENLVQGTTTYDITKFIPASARFYQQVFQTITEWPKIKFAFETQATILRAIILENSIAQLDKILADFFEKANVEIVMAVYHKIQDDLRANIKIKQIVSADTSSSDLNDKLGDMVQQMYATYTEFKEQPNFINADGRERVLWTPSEGGKMGVFANAATMARLRTVGAKFFNKGLVEIETLMKGEQFVCDKFKNGEILYLDSDGYWLSERLNETYTQTWAENMLTTNCFNLWYVGGTLNWAHSLYFILDVSGTSLQTKYNWNKAAVGYSGTPTNTGADVSGVSWNIKSDVEVPVNNTTDWIEVRIINNEIVQEIGQPTVGMTRGKDVVYDLIINATGDASGGTPFSYGYDDPQTSQFVAPIYKKFSDVGINGKLTVAPIEIIKAADKATINNTTNTNLTYQVMSYFQSIPTNSSGFNFVLGTTPQLKSEDKPNENDGKNGKSTPDNKRGKNA